MMNILKIRDGRTRRTGGMTRRCGCKTSSGGEVAAKRYIYLNIAQFNSLRYPPMLYDPVPELISSLFLSLTFRDLVSNELHLVLYIFLPKTY